jgi:hypothetical protein
MQTNRQELVHSARRRVQRGRKTTGRIVVSALGFAMAYYFDAENGGERRKRLHQMVQHATRDVNARLAPDVGDPPVVFHPVFRRHPVQGDVPSAGEGVGAVR